MVVNLRHLAITVALLIGCGVTAIAQPVSDAAPRSALAISFEMGAVAVTGATPGGKVILFGFSREPLAYGWENVNRGLTKVADATGSVKFELRKPVSPKSFYAVVDFESGGHTLAATPGFHVPVRTLPAKAWKKTDQLLTHLELDLTAIHVLCVRPGKSIQRVFTMDGAAEDRQQKVDGRIVLAAESLEPARGSERIRHFQKKDVVIMIDPERLEVYATEVSE